MKYCDVVGILQFTAALEGKYLLGWSESSFLFS